MATRRPSAGKASRAFGSSAARRPLHLVVACLVSSSELGKLAWSRWWCRDGYWWVLWSGFSVGETAWFGYFLDSECALLLALVLVELALEAAARSPLGAAGAQALHVSVALALCLCCTADFALFVGAGGARLSLPLVLFALTEARYVASVAWPWLHVLLASIAGAAAVVVALGPPLVAIVRRAAPTRRTPWSIKLAFVALCCARLHIRRVASNNVGGDFLSQLGADMVAFVRGSLLSASVDSLLTSHRVKKKDPREFYPPLLLFHWEAGSELVLRNTPTNRSAVPFLRSLEARSDVGMFTSIVTVPMTLKSSWEALCGVPPAHLSDFREQGSALRRECLPRVLARCCGYHSIIAKTDPQLPDLPRRVFGFSEAIVAPTNRELLAKLKARLGALGALEGRVPTLVFFYAGDAHAPYSLDRVSETERGYSRSAAEDVFFALHSRADAVARELASFWPPPLPAGARAWGPEHGLALYFGDHGELLAEGAPPHGNSMSPQVTQVFLALEARAFAGGRRLSARQRGLRRLADVFGTVVDCLGLHAGGRLHVGRSLLGREGHAAVASFSFYRPAELAAVHLVEEPGAERGAPMQVRTVEFQRGPGGWRPASEALSTTAAADVELAAAAFSDALTASEEANTLLTQSNVHAAWLVARLRVAAQRAKAAARSVMSLLWPALAGPQQTA